jgi:hypothetical protein
MWSLHVHTSLLVARSTTYTDLAQSPFSEVKLCPYQANVARQHAAVAEAARWRGWPVPVVYADDNVPQVADGSGPALARLEAAISAGRHDTLLLAGPATVRGNPARVMRLLASCTKHGVAVELLGPRTA